MLSLSNQPLRPVSYLGPVIAGCVGKDVALGIEVTGCDGLVKLFRRLQLGASILIPEAEATVRAYSGQGTMDWVEGDVIYLHRIKQKSSISCCGEQKLVSSNLYRHNIDKQAKHY